MELRFKQDWPIWMVSSITLAIGVLSIISILAVRFQEHPQLFHILLPFGLHLVSRSIFILGFLAFCRLTVGSTPNKIKG